MPHYVQGFSGFSACTRSSPPPPPPRGSNVSDAEILQTLISLKNAPDEKKKKEEWLDRLDIIVKNGYVPEHSEKITIAVLVARVMGPMSKRT